MSDVAVAPAPAHARAPDADVAERIARLEGLVFAPDPARAEREAREAVLEKLAARLETDLGAGKMVPWTPRGAPRAWNPVVLGFRAATTFSGLAHWREGDDALALAFALTGGGFGILALFDFFIRRFLSDAARLRCVRPLYVLFFAYLADRLYVHSRADLGPVSTLSRSFLTSAILVLFGEARPGFRALFVTAATALASSSTDVVLAGAFAYATLPALWNPCTLVIRIPIWVAAFLGVAHVAGDFPAASPVFVGFLAFRRWGGESAPERRTRAISSTISLTTLSVCLASVLVLIACLLSSSQP